MVARGKLLNELKTLNSQARERFDHGVFWTIPFSDDPVIEAKNLGYQLSKHGGMRGVAHAILIEKCLLAMGEQSWRSLNRNQNSLFAGGSVLNRDYPRRSDDLDIFHDSRDFLLDSILKDEGALSRAGDSVKFHRPNDEIHSHARALVEKDGQVTEIDWTCDSVFRFFPALEDAELGWRLHDFDLATNKILALAGRREIRDYVDILTLDREKYSIGTLACAAVAKDPGFTPELILDEISRNSKYEDEHFARVSTSEVIDPKQLKRQFLDSIASARDLFQVLPMECHGKVLLNPSGEICNMAADLVRMGDYVLHEASSYGSLPQVVTPNFKP